MPCLVRSEQDREPEQETASDVVGPGPSEEAVADGTCLAISRLNFLVIRVFFFYETFSYFSCMKELLKLQ